MKIELNMNIKQATALDIAVKDAAARWEKMARRAVDNGHSQSVKDHTRERADLYLKLLHILEDAHGLPHSSFDDVISLAGLTDDLDSALDMKLGA